MNLFFKSSKSLETAGQTYLFSKEEKLREAVTSDIKAEVNRSVGLLHIDGHPAGTGFRVGDKYIITCLHVIKDIIIQGVNSGFEFF